MEKHETAFQYILGALENFMGTLETEMGQIVSEEKKGLYINARESIVMALDEVIHAKVLLEKSEEV